MTSRRPANRDAEAVAAIERRHDLALLEQLLTERGRPVPPPPPATPDTTLKDDLTTLMVLLASCFPHANGGSIAA